MVSRGVVYVAYGDQARIQVQLSAKSLKERHPHLPLYCISDQPIPRTSRLYPHIPHIPHEDTDPGARLVKLSVDKLSPFDQTLYLDADTRIHGDLMMPFGLLDNGWEMAMVPCRHQAVDEIHGHVNDEERAATFAEAPDAYAMQGGVIYFQKTDSVHKLFAEWRNEWDRWQDQDQAALVRALVRCPVKLFVLNRAYNGGRIVQHFYTYARRDGLKYSRAV